MSWYLKGKPIWNLLKQQTVSGSGPYASLHLAPQTDNHASTPPLSFYRLDALPAGQPTASKQLKARELKACPINRVEITPISVTLVEFVA